MRKLRNISYLSFVPYRVLVKSKLSKEKISHYHLLYLLLHTKNDINHLRFKAEYIQKEYVQTH